MELTDEQVIEYLKFAQKRIADITYSPETLYAIEKAISIIQSNTVQCEDAVSRAAVIEITAETGALETQYRVKRLPPVTPKQRTGEWIDDGSELGCQCSECGKSLDEYIHATEWMTLIEIPPHGRLIDADELNIHDISPVDGFCVMGVTEEEIGLADTVIEAEGSAV